MKTDNIGESEHDSLSEDDRLLLARFFAKSAGSGFRGFSRDKRIAVAKAASLASKASGKSHRYTPEEAKVAGKKGGQMSTAGFRSWSPDKHVEVSRRAGQAAQASARCYRFTPEDRARAAAARWARREETS